MASELLADVDSIKLFVARAAARQSHFKLTAETGPRIARICCKLDGVPPAIELAAAPTGRLSLHEIEHQLDDSLRLLVGGRRSIERQEKLRATLDWSYALLADPEGVAFRRLAAFTGTFDLEAARQVCAGEAGMAGLDRLLLDLVDKSLVEAETEGPATRYRLLEPVRQYAWERLIEHREAAELQRLHAESFSARCGSESASLRGDAQIVSDSYNVPPGHDAWTVGHEPYVSIDFSSAS